MQYRLNDSLGLIDARKCNTECDAGIELDARNLKKGDLIDLSQKAATWLSKRYPNLLEPTGKVKGESKHPEITAPEKSSKQ